MLFFWRDCHEWTLFLSAVKENPLHSWQGTQRLQLFLGLLESSSSIFKEKLYIIFFFKSNSVSLCERYWQGNRIPMTSPMGCVRVARIKNIAITKMCWFHLKGSDPNCPTDSKPSWTAGAENLYRTLLTSNNPPKMQKVCLNHWC